MITLFRFSVAVLGLGLVFASRGFVPSAHAADGSRQSFAASIVAPPPDVMPVQERPGSGGLPSERPGEALPKDHPPLASEPDDGDQDGGPADKAKRASIAGRRIPDDPRQRRRLLQDLYANLAAAEDDAAATKVAQAIQRLWNASGSHTVTLLIARAMKAQEQKNLDLALSLMDAVVEIAPDYAEGWNRRAYVLFSRNELDRSLADLRRAIALDPNHFKSLDGIATILRETGNKKGALAVLERLIEVHPHWEGADRVLRELRREVEGQAL